MVTLGQAREQEFTINSIDGPCEQPARLSRSAASLLQPSKRLVFVRNASWSGTILSRTSPRPQRKLLSCCVGHLESRRTHRFYFALAVYRVRRRKLISSKLLPSCGEMVAMETYGS